MRGRIKGQARLAEERTAVCSRLAGFKSGGEVGSGTPVDRVLDEVWASSGHE